VIRQEWPKTLTAAEVFFHVAEHLRDQTERSMARDGIRCAYRGTAPESACAVGCLLTDAEAEAIKGAGANTHGVGSLDSQDLLPARLSPHVDLLRELQAIHDTTHLRGPESSVATQLRSLARVRGFQGLSALQGES
jgi:hypothetical protein